MKYFLNIFICLFLIIKIRTNNQNKPKADSCTLTGKESKDPFPSLSKCYKYNNEACCMSVHDDYIDQYVASILSPSCIRKYTDFENLMCFGCHPLESKYTGEYTITMNDTNTTIKTIRICRSFALTLWDSPESSNYEALNNPTTNFDNCGFKTDLDELKNISNGKNYILPSEKFHNFSDFFNYIKIPFYEDYEIQIQNETDDNCYNYSLYINSVLSYYISLFIFFIIL